MQLSWGLWLQVSRGCSQGVGGGSVVSSEGSAGGGPASKSICTVLAGFHRLQVLELRTAALPEASVRSSPRGPHHRAAHNVGAGSFPREHLTQKPQPFVTSSQRCHPLTSAILHSLEVSHKIQLTLKGRGVVPQLNVGSSPHCGSLYCLPFET